MSQEMEFKNIVAQYSKVAPEEMNNEMRFREDLGFSIFFNHCSCRWNKQFFQIYA